MGFLDWVANKTGKIARTTTKIGGKILRFKSKVVGGVVELTGEAVGGIVGLANERLGEAIADQSKAVARVIETPAEVVTRGIEQLTNVATGAISEAVGDTEGELDAFNEQMDTAEALADHFKDLGENASNAWDNFTAKKLFDAAKARYEELQKKQVQEQNRIDSEINNYNSLIEEHLSKINNCRSKSNGLFRQFEVYAAAFADWQVKNRVFTENFTPKIYQLDKLPSCNEIFAEINFDEDPIWTNLKGIFTFGFWNESKIKEVQDKLDKMETNTIPEAITKGNMEINRCKKISESLDFVQRNFTFFVDFYQELLQELEYSVQLIRNARYMRDTYFFKSNEKLSPYFLPDRHILCLQACDKLSRLLCELAKRQYFNDSTIEIIEKDIKRIEKYQSKVVIKLKESLAA